MGITNKFNEYDIYIKSDGKTNFVNAADVYQDGNVPLYRDVDGKLWGISGHTHLGHIGMFCGTRLDDMVEVYPAVTLFETGHKDVAFNGVRYPENVLPRGSIWPFGLYICPKTHKFFCFFHNETGWNGKGSAYDSYGLCVTPHFDSDFRHVGLMHSDDEGRHWLFDRWVLTAESVCFTERYDPDSSGVIGQKGRSVSLGSGDFTCFVEPEGEFIYLFYNIVRIDIETGLWQNCDVYVARTRKRDDGVMGDFVKYYDGSFSEAGNFGKETPVAFNSWHPQVVYNEFMKSYAMISVRIRPNAPLDEVVTNASQVRTSDNLLIWSEPITLTADGKTFGNHYLSMASVGSTGKPNVVGEQFYIMSCNNGTDVLKFRAEMKKR